MQTNTMAYNYETQKQQEISTQYRHETGMWANDQRDGRPAEYRWRPLSEVWLTPTTGVPCIDAVKTQNR